MRPGFLLTLALILSIALEGVGRTYMVPGIAVVIFGVFWFLATKFRWPFFTQATKAKWAQEVLGEQGATCLDYTMSGVIIIIGLLIIAFRYGE
jgi:hypothetical protein